MKVVVMVNGRPEGPFELEALKDAIRKGEISPLALCWYEGQRGWSELQKMPQIQSVFGGDPQAAMNAPREDLSKEVPPTAKAVRVSVKAQDEIRGPYTIEQLKVEIGARRVSLSDLGRMDEATEWLQLKDIPEILDLVLPQPPEMLQNRAATADYASVMDISTGAPTSAEAFQRSTTYLDARPSWPTAEIPTETTSTKRASTTCELPFCVGADYKLATPRSRLFAQFAEFAIASIAFVLFVGVGTVFSATSEPSSILTITYLLLWFVVNSVLVATRGQTVGKMVFGIKIVDSQTGHPGGARMLFLRYWALILLSWLSCAAPVFYMVWILAFVCDSLFIFRQDHRCLHDLVARTCVIQCGRPLLSSNLQPQRT